MHQHVKKRWFSLLTIVVLVCLPLLIGGQVTAQEDQTEALTLTTGRPAPNQDRRPGDPVLAPGEDTFTVQVTMTGGICPTVERTQPVDVVMVIDVSGSMQVDTGMGISRMEAARMAASNFVGRFNLDPLDNIGSDQIALVKFSSTASIISRGDLSQPYSSNNAFSRRPNELRQSINDELIASGGTSITRGLQVARDVLDGMGRNLEGGSVAAIVLMTDADRIPDHPGIMREVETLRRQLRARIVTIGFGDAIDRQLLEAIADPGDTYYAVTPDQLNAVYDEIATRIQPATAAENVNLVYTVNSASYELRPDTIVPPPLRVEGNVITWPPVIQLDRGARQNFTFEVRALNPGGASVGQASADYNACLEEEASVATASGPVVQALLPTPTPTPTSTPTPTATPTPTPTPSATPPAFISDTTEYVEPTGVGTSGSLCEPGLASLLPWLGALLALLVAIWLLYNSFKRLRNQQDTGCRTYVCLLLRTLLALYGVFLVFLLLQPLERAICTIPESVYFWRMEGNVSGIYVTNEHLNRNAEPAQVTRLNQYGCVGCHVIGSEDGPVLAIAGGVPGALVGTTLDDEALSLPNVSAVYAALSPDGQRIAYSDTDANLYIVELAGGIPRQLNLVSDDTYGALMPTWAANGQQIAYVRAPRSQIQLGLVVFNNSEIYVANVQDDQPPQPLIIPERLGGAVGLNYYPNFSPDGRWLAFTRHENSGGTSYAAPEANIWLMDLRTFEARPIRSNDVNASDSWPTWNRDGTRMAFNTTRLDVSYDIVIVDVDEAGTTSNLVMLPGASQPGVFEHIPVWGPPPARISLMDELRSLLPWLLPFLLLLPLVIACSLFRSRKPIEDIIDEELPSYQRAVPLGTGQLPSWKGIDALWEPQPALVIGLGRAGWHVLTQLKKTLKDAGLGKPSEKVRLLCIIAGEEQNLVDKSFSGLELEDHELIRWQDSLRDLIQGANQDEALRGWINTHYFDQVTDSANNPRIGLKGNRVLGRLAFINNLRGRTEQTGQSLWHLFKTSGSQVIDERVLTVILVSDTSDDVGSGALLDAAYSIKRLRERENLNLDNVRLIGHLLTERATVGRNLDDINPTVNTAATLRELSRFQLAGGAPFPMTYTSHSASDIEQDATNLEGEWRGVLFDELYVHDSERQPNRLNNPPEQGIYPAVADSIALWLDIAAKKGALARRRQDIMRNSIQAQINNRQMMMGAMGIYQYRLPFADLLEEITVHYARQVLQRLLMGESNETPAYDVTNVKEVFDRVGADPRKLASLFLREELGSPEELSEHWRRLLKSILERDETGTRRSLGKLQTDPTSDEHAWKVWVGSVVEVILNGVEVKGETNPDILTKRGAKVSLAYEFLDYLGSNLLRSYIHLVRNIDPDHDAIKQLERFAVLTEQMRDNLSRVAYALGVEPTEDALYTKLALREAVIKQRNNTLQSIQTREYVVTDADDKSLADRWYKHYLEKHVIDSLRQMTWTLDDGTPVLRMELPARTDQPTRVIEFNPDDPTEFEETLLELGRYFARDIRYKESLSDLLSQNQLSRDNIEHTQQSLLQKCGVLLGLSRGANDASVHLREGLVFSAKNLAGADDLLSRLQRAVQRPEDLIELETTDPFTLTLAKTVDGIPIEAVSSLREAQRQYSDQVHSESAGQQPTAIFQAEATAIEYERRLGEISQPRRLFNPLVVTALARRTQAETYLLAVVAAEITGEWRMDDRRGLVFNTKETGELQLIADTEMSSLPFCGLLDGMLRFSSQVTTQQARQIYDRYLEDDDVMVAIDEWEQHGGDDWRERYTDCGIEVVEDLIAVTRLLIRRLL